MSGLSPDDRPPMVEAMSWVSRVTTVTMEIVLPGLLGGWLDRRWGTKFLALVGFGLGLVCGIQHLLVMTRMQDPSVPPTGDETPPSDSTTDNREAENQ